MIKLTKLRSTKDRIICVGEVENLIFYYNPFQTSDRIYLFETKAFYGSVFAYFRKMGRNMQARGFSLTIKELYEFCDYNNPRLTGIIHRIFIVLKSVLSDENDRAA
ncbi:MAG: hypothetical protein E7559_00125 [Ruminococcaceae bacterium]|nr:hypothetical protein [Oscillospiraceae bacterium]